MNDYSLAGKHMICKIPLEDLSERMKFLLPKDTKFLTAQVQRGKLCLWYECTMPFSSDDEKFFYLGIFGTGNDMGLYPHDKEYICTSQMPNGLVWHLYRLHGE